MLHLPPAYDETSKHNSPNETKVKEKQNKTISDSNSNLTKSMTHHNQIKELITWFLSYTSWRGVGTLKWISQVLKWHWRRQTNKVKELEARSKRKTSSNSR
jgi:hypothetical protein